MPRKTPKNQLLDDGEFLTKYFELGESPSALAQFLNVTRQGVHKRLKKIGKEKIERAKELGNTALVVAEAVATVRNPGVVAFNRGVSEGADVWRSFEQLPEYADMIKAIVMVVQGDINKHMAKPNSKISYHHVEMMCKSVGQAARLAETIHKIMKDKYSVQRVKDYIAAVQAVIEEELPDGQQRIFNRLRAMGVAPTFTPRATDIASDPGTADD